MPQLTRRRSPHRHEECWLIYYGDVHAGTITERVGNPHDTDRWEWRCGFYPGSEPGECSSGTAETFDKARADFEVAGRCSWPTAPRPIFRNGAMSGTGRLRSIAGLIAVSACRPTGNRHRLKCDEIP
jgi:hypothetical protein